MTLHLPLLHTSTSQMPWGGGGGERETFDVRRGAKQLTVYGNSAVPSEVSVLVIPNAQEDTGYYIERLVSHNNPSLIVAKLAKQHALSETLVSIY